MQFLWKSKYAQHLYVTFSDKSICDEVFFTKLFYGTHFSYFSSNNNNIDRIQTNCFEKTPVYESISLSFLGHVIKRSNVIKFRVKTGGYLCTMYRYVIPLNNE